MVTQNRLFLRLYFLCQDVNFRVIFPSSLHLYHCHRHHHHHRYIHRGTGPAVLKYHGAECQHVCYRPQREALLQEIDSEKLTDEKIAIATILLLMTSFQESVDNIFIRTDPTSTKMSEADITLPTTPRVVMLGRSLLTSHEWMVSIEKKIWCEASQLPDFTSALALFFASFYVFNLEYQEAASTTLEMVQRFFVRINPDEGTKCTAKQGTSRKTGGVVKRRVTSVNNRVMTFIQWLTEFEWMTSN
ncbi:uncharacterized protein LOC121678144 isoform X2 [Alosa sapidissima]|uniref:uncharacterized protein LOC121678144 isoform X2 n=1 Tax=Alosa sapidissima TaxID=34773 RepID=UPI001C092C62|nr:uncharacterized protein LOC121678144 isoform X2 [Alosa sapidissima]